MALGRDDRRLLVAASCLESSPKSQSQRGNCTCYSVILMRASINRYAHRVARTRHTRTVPLLVHMSIFYHAFQTALTILRSHSHFSIPRQTDKARIRERRGEKKGGFHYTRGFAPNPVNTVKFLCDTARMLDCDCECLLEVRCEGG